MSDDEFARYTQFQMLQQPSTSSTATLVQSGKSTPLLATHQPPRLLIQVPLII